MVIPEFALSDILLSIEKVRNRLNILEDITEESLLKQDCVDIINSIFQIKKYLIK